MDWWQTVGLMATLVATATAVATLGWRIMLRLQREIAGTRRELGSEIQRMRQELGRETAKLRDDIGADMAKLRDELRAEMAEFRDELRADMAKLRDELRAEMAKVRTDLGADIVSGRDGLVSVGEGLAELRGEVRGVQKAMLALQEDFRIHVYGRRARA